jgi:hypothetical protein
MKRYTLISFAITFLATPVFAYKTDIHQLISIGATTLSMNYQRFVSGSDIESNYANGILLYGSVAEDNESFLLKRYIYHFYDPISGKGLEGIADSAPVWGYNHAIPFNEFSWVEARKALYDGFTAETLEIRKENFYKTIRSLGQIVHLIEDMAQPSHTRNDPHASHYESETGAKIYNPSHLEDWAHNNPAEFFAIVNTAAAAKSVFSFDDAFESMALFSNENFFSDDTIFKNYDYPSKDQTNYSPEDFINWGIGNIGQVLAEDGEIYDVPYIVMEDGPYTGYKLAQVGYFGKPLVQFTEFLPLALQIDDEVARENAQILIPWAVEYSAGLLDYFFRGDLEAEADGDDGIKITNQSDENLNGVFSLYYDAADGKRYPVADASWSMALDAKEESATLDYTEPTDPAPKDPGKYLLVFKGEEGQEESAVIGVFIELMSESPFYAGIYNSGSMVYWDVQNDREVELEDIALISTQLKNPKTQTYLTSIPVDNCGYTNLINYEWTGSCTSYWSGTNPGDIFLPGVNDPIGTRFYLTTAGGSWDGVYFNMTSQTHSDISDDIFGFRIVRDIYEIVIGINYTGTYDEDFSESYKKVFNGFENLLYSRLSVSDFDSKFGIFTSTLGVLGDRDEEYLSTYVISRENSDPETRTGTYYNPIRGAVTNQDFDPSKTWVITVSNEYPSLALVVSVYVRVDRFDNSDTELVHEGATRLPNLEEYLFNNQYAVLNGLYSGKEK